MKKLVLCLFVIPLLVQLGKAQNFSRYAPLIEHQIPGSQIVDMTINADGSMAFLKDNDVIYGTIAFRSPDGDLTSSDTYKCGNDVPNVLRILNHPEGGYYVLGYHQHLQNAPLCPNFHYDTLMMLAHPDIWVLRVDDIGTVLWSQSVGGSKPDGLNTAWVCADGGIALFGHTNSNDGDVSNTDNPPNGFFNAPWMARLSPDGNVLWDFQPPWTLESSNYLFSGLELSDGKFMAFSIENNGFVEAYTLSSDGEELSHATIPLPNDNVQGFSQVLPYGNDKVILAGTGGQPTFTVHREAYFLLIDTDGNKLAERSLPDAVQDHYFGSMFLDGDEIIATGYFYDYDYLSLASLQLPSLEVTSYQKFQSSQVPYARKIVPMAQNRLGVLTNVEGDFDFQWTQDTWKKGFLEFESCNVMADFTYENIGNQTIQFYNNSANGAVDFSWDFAGFGTSFSENPTFTFPGTFSYQVCLTAANQLQCVEEVCINVAVGTTSTQDVAFSNTQIIVNGDHLQINGLEMDADVALYNPAGILIKKEKATRFQFDSDISSLVSGVYVLVLKNELGLHTVKFVKH